MSRFDDYLDTVNDDPPPIAPPPRELVVDRRTGTVRQAGASQQGQWIIDFKAAAERSLFTFSVGVMGRTYLTEALHHPICDFIQTRPPQRKLILFPREHGKTSIASHCLPAHMLIQSPDSNPYFDGVGGEDTRILLAGETEQRGTDNLRVIQTAFETNQILRGLWPHRVWEEPRRQAKKWNDREMILPRTREYPDPSVRAVGVGGAITGMHPTVLLKDDLISFEASNSPTVMQTAIQWHVASRGLINDPTCLEIMIGTRWAAYDLYRYIEESDPSVSILRRAAIEDGLPIYPEKFTLEMLDRLRVEFGVLFPLLYLNTAVDSTLTDFDMNLVRKYRVIGRDLVYDEDGRDLALHQRHDETPQPPAGGRRRFADVTETTGRGEYLRLKYS